MLKLAITVSHKSESSYKSKDKNYIKSYVTWKLFSDYLLLNILKDLKRI